MNRNVGTTDRVVRVIAGVAIVGAGVYFQSWWGAIGIIPLATAMMGWCPPYALLGINTRKTS